MNSFFDLMLSLDRCEHGRHVVDNCLSCAPHENVGNTLVVPGQQIGWTVRGDRIVVPDPSRETGIWSDPRAWVQSR